MDTRTKELCDHTGSNRNCHETPTRIFGKEPITISATIMLPYCRWKRKKRFFSFVVKTEFSESHHRFDQCGVVLYLDSENWLKGSIEYENETFQHLGSVVTNHGYSDWSTTEISAHINPCGTA